MTARYLDDFVTSRAGLLRVLEALRDHAAPAAEGTTRDAIELAITELIVDMGGEGCRPRKT